MSEEEIVTETTSKEETEVKDKKKEKDKTSKKIDELNSQVEYWKNKYYTSYADLENLRKAIERDHHEAIKYRSEGFIEKLITPLDGFHLALSMEPKNEEMKAFLQGFSFIYQNIIQAMESEGVSEIVPTLNQKFDVNTMHAVDTIECPDLEENLVVKVYANGYKLHDRIVRPAMVYVSIKKKEEVKDENKEAENA